MQETHVKAFEELPKLQHPASYKTWISKIMIHKCNYKLKHGYFKKEKPQDETINAKYDTIYSGKEMMQTENRLQDANFLKCWNQVFKIFHSITELCSF
jgi:RNA polymerase sigma-70 factor (ECF subfamily)